jgi:hypothetical protein
VQIEEPVAEYLPAVQFSQATVPAKALYLPTAHRAQLPATPLYAACQSENHVFRWVPIAPRKPRFLVKKPLKP